MRKLIITLTIWLLGSLTMLAQQPAWVSSHPTDANAYIGIGFAPVKDADYIQKATQNALNDIAGWSRTRSCTPSTLTASPGNCLRRR